MAKLTTAEKREYFNLQDIDFDAYEDLNPEQLVRYRELAVRFDAEEERRREYMDEAYDRAEDFYED